MVEQRIEKYIASCGICSRRDATDLILKGDIKKNNKIVLDPSTKVLKEDVILYRNNLILPQKKVKIWKYYKPTGVICTHKDPFDRSTVFEQLNIKEYVISVGRLDVNSEGLLLITNNAEFARYMELPSNRMRRVYKVRAFGNIGKFLISSKKNIESLLGYNIESVYLLRKGQTNHWFKIVLTEGKNREVRNIFQFFGLRVNRLIRVCYGRYNLGHMRPGECILCKDYV